MARPCFIYLTCPNARVAKKIVATLLTERKIACGNILPAMTSLYRWQGQVERAREVVVILKTSVRQYRQVQNRVVDLHPYTCPCIVELKIGRALKEYENWILRETRGR